MSKEHFRRKNKQTAISGLFLDSWSGFQEYLQHCPEKIVKISCPAKELKRLEAMLANHSLQVPIEEDKIGLRVFIKEDMCHEVELEGRDLSNSSVVLALDHITDTRNLGAILRSAAFFGVETVVVPSKRQAPLAQGTISTCQGALAFTKVYSVVNLVRSLKWLKKQGFWVIGADMNGEDLAEYSEKFDKVVLVMGSEDKGLSRLVREVCDVIVSIKAAPQAVESLNVSVATGILIQQFTKSSLTV